MEKKRVPVVLGYSPDKTRLRITLDLTQHWEERTDKQKRIYERNNNQIAYKADIAFRCNVWLSMPLHHFSDFETRLPQALFEENPEGPWTFALSETLLTIAIPASDEFWKNQKKTEHGWLKASHATYFNFYGLTRRRRSLLDMAPNLPIGHNKNIEPGPEVWISVTVFRLGGPPMLHPEVREEFEDKRVISGGRPESNRRRF